MKKLNDDRMNFIGFTIALIIYIVMIFFALGCSGSDYEKLYLQEKENHLQTVQTYEVKTDSLNLWIELLSNNIDSLYTTSSNKIDSLKNIILFKDNTVIFMLNQINDDVLNYINNLKGF